jgi:hypothetical protein
MGSLPVADAILDGQDGVVGEIVNLRQMKKRRERDLASEAAKQNRVRHGRTGAEKADTRRAEARRQALLDASRRGEAGE